MTIKARKEKTFEEAMDRLETIVSEIESDGLGLERQFELFQEGMALARFCDGRLTEVQKSVEVVLKESAGEWKTAPFEPGEAPRKRTADGDDRHEVGDILRPRERSTRARELAPPDGPRRRN